MPLTAVGKIFKPALRIEAVRQCVRDATARLDRAGDLCIEVRDLSGTLVVVLKALDPSNVGCLEHVRRELERYTLKIEVDWGTGLEPERRSGL